jgi:hypothetical protein
MIIRRKHWALQTGYDVSTDCPFGFTLCLGQRIKTKYQSGPVYRLVIGLSFDWPKLLWAEEAWAMNERGYIRGMPVARQGIRSSAWTGRARHLAGITWYRNFSVAKYD